MIGFKNQCHFKFYATGTDVQTEIVLQRYMRCDNTIMKLNLFKTKLAISINHQETTKEKMRKDKKDFYVKWNK